MNPKHVDVFASSVDRKKSIVFGTDIVQTFKRQIYGGWNW